MEQATIPEFFSARKRPTEGVHAAKRRKTIEAETGEVDGIIKARRSTRVAKTARGDARPRTTRSRTRTRVLSTKSNDSPVSTVDIQELMQKTTGKPPSINGAETQRTIGEITSVHDDHAFEDALNGNANETGNRRKSSVSLRNFEASLSPEKAQNQVVSPRKIVSAVRCNPDGLKPNPWIAEQAKSVFLSRGQAAVARSRKMVGTDNKQPATQAQTPDTARVTSEVNGLQKNKKGLKLSKTKQDLEKARELCKTMRSLRSKGESAKEMLTRDTSERLHNVASGAASKEASSGKAPAFERYHSLVAPAPVASEGMAPLFPLPYKYKTLCEIFRSCDTVLNLLGQRNERCNFTKLKESVQKMCRKKMEKKHLGQINTVFPDALIFHQEKTSPQSNQKFGYELTVEFGCKSSSDNDKRTLNTGEVLSRKNAFQENLLDLTKSHHQAFLSSLSPPVIVDQSKIKRWHPKFKLDDVPDIDVSAVPEPPVTKSFTSAQDCLNTARELMIPGVQRALKTVADKSAKENSSEAEVKSSESTENVNMANSKKPTNNALKGISQDLLDKIRQKAAKKVEESLLRDPAIDKKLSMKERLPELCRILKNYFVTERKAAIPLEDTRTKLSESCPSSLSPAQIEVHLWLIAELAPDWLSILTVRKCQYVKINKNADIKSVVKKLGTKQIH